MKKKLITNISLFIFSTCILLAMGEIYVRHKGHFDVDGNFYFNNNRIKPYKIPLKQVESTLNHYLNHPDSYLMYDQDIGWVIRPESKSDDGLYESDSRGLRSPSTGASPDRVPGRLRILLMGDSFAHGNEVPFEHSMGYILENNLKREGIDAEVLNLGVPGYGIDQSYLRWKKSAGDLRPDIVILGFIADDILRNLMIFWSVRTGGGSLFFSKPRFILSDDSLILTNQPTIKPENIMEVLSDFKNSELAEYEYFYQESDYAERFWHTSKFLTLLFDQPPNNLYRENNAEKKNTKNKRVNLYSFEAEPSRLALKLLEEFNSEVSSSGAKFMLVYFPIQSELRSISMGYRDVLFSDLLKKLDESYTLILPENNMLKALKKAPIESLYNEHYSHEGNIIIADTISEHLVKTLKSPQ